jgi:hypothetical protein
MPGMSTARRVPRAEVDDLEPIRFLAVCEKNREAVIAPDLILCGLFRVLDLRLEIRPFIAIELAAKGAVGDFAGDPLPCEPQFHFLPKIPPGFLEICVLF